MCLNDKNPSLTSERGFLIQVGAEGCEIAGRVLK